MCVLFFLLSYYHLVCILCELLQIFWFLSPQIEAYLFCFEWLCKNRESEWSNITHILKDFFAKKMRLSRLKRKLRYGKTLCIIISLMRSVEMETRKMMMMAVRKSSTHLFRDTLNNWLTRHNGLKCTLLFLPPRFLVEST